MVQKCKRCGAKIIKFPFYEGQEDGIKFELGKTKINWINLFKIDWYSLILILLIVFMVIGYKSDISKCEKVINDPCEFCEESNCCQVDWSRISPNKLIERNRMNIFNSTKY